MNRTRGTDEKQWKRSIYITPLEIANFSTILSLPSVEITVFRGHPCHSSSTAAHSFLTQYNRRLLSLIGLVARAPATRPRRLLGMDVLSYIYSCALLVSSVSPSAFMPPDILWLAESKYKFFFYPSIHFFFLNFLTYL